MARTRIYGPYKRGRGWVVALVEEGARSDRRFACEEEAHRWIAEVEKELELEGPITVEAALVAYEGALALGARRPSSVETDLQRVRRMLAPGHRLRRLALLEGGECQQVSVLLAGKCAAATHRGIVGAAKRFGSWCVEQGWIRTNPWAKVKPVGRPRKGKMQLRVDEARRFLATAQELAEAGDDSAVAAMCCLVLGLRASEVIERVGRDVDDSGRLLWIDVSKTAAGRRALEVPQLLSDLLARLAAHASGHVFSGDRHWLGYHVRRICRLAGVPVVCPHGLRGTHASLAMSAGASSQLVAQSLGHASDAVTLAHYARPEAVQSGRTERAMRVIAGGKR